MFEGTVEELTVSHSHRPRYRSLEILAPSRCGERRETTLWRTHCKRLTTVVGIIAAGAVVMTMSASAHSTKAGSIKSGGTLNVGWEQSFGFTDNFDPTGDYSADAWGSART